MKAKEYEDKLYTLAHICGLNQRYHQRMARRWALVDRVAKIAVALVAIIALAALMGERYERLEFWMATLAALFAVVLNVVPFGEFEKFATEMFRGWSDLRIDVETQSARVEADADGNIAPHKVERLTEMLAKSHALDAKEPAPWRRLLRKCQEDETESEWGEGIRTPAQMAAARTARTNPQPEAVAADVQ